MNELDDCFAEYFTTIKSPEQREIFRQILIQTMLMLELNSYPEMDGGNPSFFLNDQPVIGFSANTEQIEIIPQNIVALKTAVSWDHDFPFDHVKKLVKLREAELLEDIEGVDRAED
ncbi:hypothetical protein [Xylocopilactobacillus apicola]|uniref:Uncharacterized protein n=1 Tax=Xylocopilactobacillus apicola TaxID=2932184 RepID=A0AAU9DD31_9LACO|nr:hypothetical protein [Xylocopilactobacillus apicola]BDR59470.1 hypothetical protein XA3_19110 [Xylocopilactobacillus apicola]